MKTLNDHVIIYDDECPACNLYTGVFVKTAMLDKNGREAYTTMDQQLHSIVDKKRACNEIALVNTKQQTVTYGIDSLFIVIGHAIPLFKPLFSFRPFRWVMRKVYSLISYNRKIIVPGKIFEKENVCVPSFNLKYRWMYILLTWIITSWILKSFSGLVFPFIPPSNFYREFFICSGQIIFQSIVISFLRRDRVIHYLGNMMTISFGGALLLLPALILPYVNLPILYIGWFMFIVMFMFIEHARRVKLLGIHWLASVSWVVYRLIILLIIL